MSEEEKGRKECREDKGEEKRGAEKEKEREHGMEAMELGVDTKSIMPRGNGLF